MLPCSMNQLTQLLDHLTPERKPDIMEGKYSDISEVLKARSPRQSGGWSNRIFKGSQPFLQMLFKVPKAPLLSQIDMKKASWGSRETRKDHKERA